MYERKTRKFRIIRQLKEGLSPPLNLTLYILTYTGGNKMKKIILVTTIIAITSLIMLISFQSFAQMH